MNSASQNRQMPAQPLPQNLSSSAANPGAPLPAAEIESLLRSARKGFIQPAQLESSEELGPGDVQHLRGGSIVDSGDPNEFASMPSQLERQRSVEISPGPSERRIAQAVLDSHQEPRGGLTLDDLADVDLDISIELGRTEILIEEVLKLREGSVVALDRLAGDPVDIIANGRLIARGELLVVEGKFAVRLSEVL